jgi:hypothetical protein
MIKAFVLVCFLSHLPLGPAAASGPVTIRKVIDASDQLPGLTGPLHGFNQAAINRGAVTFVCYEENWMRQSIYTHRDASFQRVATTSETLLDGTPLLLYSSFGNSPLVRPDGAIVFEGLVGSKPTLMEWKDGALRKLFNATDAKAIIGPNAEMYSHIPVVTDDGRVVRELSDGVATVLVQEHAGQISVLQRADIPLPPYNTTGARFLGWHAFRGGLVFNEYLVTDRVYRKLGNGIESIAEERDGGFPGLPYGVNFLSDLKADQRLTTMLGRRRVTWEETRYGLYGWAGGSWFTIAETAMPAPGGGTYTEMPAHARDYSLVNGTLVFSAYTTAGQGIFLYRDGTVTPVVLTGQTFEGTRFFAFGLGSHALSGHELAFSAHMTDSSKHGIYVADISPLLEETPGTLPLDARHGPGKQVKLTVQGREGYVYYLHRSTGPDASTIVDQKMGTGAPLVFTRDERAAGDKRAFFRIEEVKR